MFRSATLSKAIISTIGGQMEWFVLMEDEKYFGSPSKDSGQSFGLYDEFSPDTVYLGSQITMFGFGKQMNKIFGLQLKLRKFDVEQL